MPLPRSTDDWISWRSLGVTTNVETAGITYKLYVCPAREVFRATFEPTVSCLARHSAMQFKIGSGSFALARPDKFVAYFHRRDDLFACMQELDRSLKGYAAHPVPFAAGASPTGMVAWGVDFALEPSTQEQTSWRWWICERLARYLCKAREQTPDKRLGIDFALLRLGLDDVELETFSPSDRLLLDAASSLSHTTHA